MKIKEFLANINVFFSNYIAGVLFLLLEPGKKKKKFKGILHIHTIIRFPS